MRKPTAYDPTVPFWRLRLLLLAAAASASLASCNGGGSPLGALGVERRAPNAADAAFLRSMTEHSKATLGITRLAQHRALRTELRRIARTMTTEQHANLRDLGSLAQGVAGRAARPPAKTRAPSSAMLDLARVKDATSFDHEFMRTMIEQNQAAIAIAHEEVRLGSDPDAKRLAAAIESSRKKELDRIRAWLHLWYGEIQPPSGGGGDQKPNPGPRSGSPVPL
ncbi:MAG: hypothetical protein QOF65_2825 [Thermoleophilaceae bacterium]|nr:hypothetical protein [Thermoleophilaceae bacterium]